MWKIINNFEDYEINELGQVRSAKKRTVLKVRPTNCGYLRVALYKNGMRKELSIHRLVAEAFIPHSDSLKTDVNHINGIKTDNRVENLEWVTKSENIIHAQENGLKTYYSLYKKISVIINGEKQIFNSVKDASSFLNCSHQLVSREAKRKGKVKGFLVEYA